MFEVGQPRRAIVLVAGRGRRLRPHTDQTPKPLLPVAGRPILDYVLEALVEAAVVDVCLVTFYLAEQIEAHVADGSAWGLNVSIRRQPALLGTAHAVQAAADFITTPCFIVAGDYALPRDYLQTLAVAYQQAGKPLAVSLKALPEGELSQRSSVHFADDGRILEIVEKPAPGAAPSHVGASLIYIVPPAIRNYLLQLPLSPRQEYELPAVINRMLRNGYEITGCLQPPPPEWSE